MNAERTLIHLCKYMTFMIRTIVGPVHLDNRSTDTVISFEESILCFVNIIMLYTIVTTKNLQIYFFVKDFFWIIIQALCA